MTTEKSKIVRDPLWNTIRLTSTAMRIVDTPSFQRLRYIRQLGFAHLVYPGATHTRFDHALGVYHLASTAIRLLQERETVPDDVWVDAPLVPYAALLHDIGHYAYSHALEELEPENIPADHEEVSARFYCICPEQDVAYSTGYVGDAVFRSDALYPRGMPRHAMNDCPI